MRKEIEKILEKAINEVESGEVESLYHIKDNVLKHVDKIENQTRSLLDAIESNLESIQGDSDYIPIVRYQYFNEEFGELKKLIGDCD